MYRCLHGRFDPRRHAWLHCSPNSLVLRCTSDSLLSGFVQATTRLSVVPMYLEEGGREGGKEGKEKTFKRWEGLSNSKLGGIYVLCYTSARLTCMCSWCVLRWAHNMFNYNMFILNKSCVYIHTIVEGFECGCVAMERPWYITMLN